MILILLCLSAQAQFVLSGLVVDHESGEGLPGALVSIHELDQATVTNEQGQFRFESIRPATYHIHVSFIGYQSYTNGLSLKNEEPLIIRLEQTAIELNEIVVESNHYKTGPRSHTLAMEIIDADFLRENRKATLVNSLEDLPGINAINTGVGISKPVIRGLSFNRVIVNDKGIKQEGQQWGTDHGLEIDMFEPGRVEVIKGPSSLMYGSDGLGGVLNIFPASLPQKGTMQGSFQSLYKTNNQNFSTSTALEGNQKGFVYRMRFSSQDFGDYQVPATNFSFNETILNINEKKLKNTAGRERSFTGMVGVKKNWGYSTITVSNFHQDAGFFVGAFGIPNNNILESDGDSRNIDIPRQSINHFKVINNNNILIGSNWLELDLGYQNNQRKEIAVPHTHRNGPVPEGTLALGLLLHTASLNARYFIHQNNDHTRILGFQGQYQRNERSGFEFLLPNFSSFSAGAFVYEERSWANKFTATGGLRFDIANRDITGYDQPIYSDDTTIDRFYERVGTFDKNFFNASGALGFSYYPSKHFNLKINMGSSYKVPTAAELGINGFHHGTFRHELGDENLTSERGFQGDLSLSYQRSNLSLVLSPFASYFDSFIYLAPSSNFSSSLDSDAFRGESGQVFHYRQNNAFFTGGEFAAEYHPIHDLHLKTAFEYVYNYNLNTSLPLPITPPPSIFVEVNYEIERTPEFLEGLKVGFSYKSVFDQNRVDRNERSTPGYHLLGTNIGTKVVLGNYSADLIFSIQNLTNEKYLNHLSRYRLLNLPEQGRNFIISLNIPFAIK
ncbi:MAG: TonB-dependent receptor [Cyclobacteriaceae bacterium]